MSFHLFLSSAALLPYHKYLTVIIHIYPSSIFLLDSLLSFFPQPCPLVSVHVINHSNPSTHVLHTPLHRNKPEIRYRHSLVPKVNEKISKSENSIRRIKYSRVFVHLVLKAILWTSLRSYLTNDATKSLCTCEEFNYC